MRLHRSQIPFFLIAFVLAGEAKAQQISQLGIGNYGMVHSMYLNPSLPAYGKYVWQINLAGFWVNANNNYLSLHMPYSLYKIPNRIPSAYKTESGNPMFDRNWLREHLNGNPKQVSVASDIYGPSASVRIHSWTLGLFTQASASVRVNRLPENLAHAFYKELDSTQGAFTQFKTYDQGGLNLFNAFSINGNSRINLGLNIAKAIKIDWGRQILLGVSVKKVWGMPGMYFNSDGMKVQAVSGDSMVFSPMRMQLITYGETIGKGWGTDIGATYIFHKKDFKRNGEYAKTRTNYFCKLGVSIMDIGSIKYKNARFDEVSITNETGVKLDKAFSNSVSNSGNYQAVVDSFMTKFGSYKQYTSDIVVGLPTRLIANADFQLRKHVFVAAIVSQSLRKKMSIHSRYQSFVMVSPRLEYRYFEFSLPTLVEYDYRSVRVGASFRFGPLYFGTNSLASFLYTKGLRDADVFAGIAFGNLSEFSFKKLAKSKQNKKAKARQNCGVF